MRAFFHRSWDVPFPRASRLRARDGSLKGPRVRLRLRLHSRLRAGALVKGEVVVWHDGVPPLRWKVLLDRVLLEVTDAVPHLVARVQEHFVRTRGDHGWCVETSVGKRWRRRSTCNRAPGSLRGSVRRSLAASRCRSRRWGSSKAPRAPRGTPSARGE